MDSLSEGLQRVLTNKQHVGNKNMNILQENINNLQKQLLEKDKIIRSLIETLNDLKSQITKRDPESTKCEH